jgi:hypothetical protein
MSRISRVGTHVDLTIMGLSEELIHEFSVYVLPKYPGGIAEAIIDLMRKAIKEQKEKGKEGITHSS